MAKRIYRLARGAHMRYVRMIVQCAPYDCSMREGARLPVPVITDCKADLDIVVQHGGKDGQEVRVVDVVRRDPCEIKPARELMPVVERIR